MHDDAATKATIQRLVKAGFTVQYGPSQETNALRIRVWKEGGKGITQFVSWACLDQSRGDSVLRVTFDEIERQLCG